MNRTNPIVSVMIWLGLLAGPLHSQPAPEAATAPATAAASANARPRSGSGTTPKPEEVLVMASFQVESDRDEGYISNQTIAGARTVESLKNTPNSISILNRELIDDLNATSVAELMNFSVAGGQSDNTEATAPAYMFRGQVSNITLRNSVNWFIPLDTFSIQRVEVLRGPQAFLYGEGTPGGILNQITKQAIGRDFQNVALIVGSFDKRRVELDVNRKLSDTWFARANFVVADESSFVHHTGRKIQAVAGALTYRPFQNTTLTFNSEGGSIDERRPSAMLGDQYSRTPLTGAATAGTNAITETTGGYTLLPATGQIINTVGLRRSTGSNLAVFDPSVNPRENNFLGPDAKFLWDYYALSAALDQSIGKNLALQAVTSFQRNNRDITTRAGTAAGDIFIDRDPLIGGVANPNFNQLYTEQYVRSQQVRFEIFDIRASAIYKLQLPFTEQQLIATGVYKTIDINQIFFSEFVDPASSSFSGTLSGDQTLAAYTANRNLYLRNYFYRRFYLRDGDGDKITGFHTVPGRSVWLRDFAADGGTGRLTNRKYAVPGYGFGASGKYFNDRVRTLFGWRRDFFNQDPGRDFYNPLTKADYSLATSPNQRVRLEHDSISIGGVVHLTKFLTAYYNRSDAVALSAGFGGDNLIAGTVRGPVAGDGDEYGLRWDFFGGRLQSNWTYFTTNSLRVDATPALTAAVRAEVLASGLAGYNSLGADTVSYRSKGYELETVANLTRHWRLIWNVASGDVETFDRFTSLKRFQADAKAAGKTTLATDAFLTTVPDGTPIPGFTKLSSNLVTRYSFEQGILKGFNVGGGFQYRDRGFRGNFDVAQDGFAEELWSTGYTVWNASAGYRTRLFNRPASLSLTVNNLFDRVTWRSTSTTSGVWGQRRSFTFALRTQL